MDVRALKALVLSNKIPSMLIFVGRDPFFAKMYLTMMSDTLGKSLNYYDSAEAALYDISTNFKDDYLFVVANDNKVLGQKDYIAPLTLSDRNVVILFDDIDSSSSFYSTHKNIIVEFDKQDELTVLAYVQKVCSDNKVAVDQQKLIEIIRRCECSLGKVMNEMEKIFVLEQPNSNTLFDYMMLNGFSDYRTYNVQSFLSNVLAGNKKFASEYIKVDDSVVSVVYSLYNMAKNRLLATRDPRYADIMKKSYFIYNGIVDGSLNADWALKYFVNECLPYSEGV